MNTLTTDVEMYFSRLWVEGEKQWQAGEVIPAKMKDGATVPIDYCLSTIARLQGQNNAPIENVQSIQDQLRQISAGQFFYPLESIHISLLGCTPRLPSPKDFTEAKINMVLQVCDSVLKNFHSPTMTLRGLNIVGPQVFIQVFPHDRLWAELRQKLEDALQQAGEEPLVHLNKNPIHINIMRITDNESEILSLLLAKIKQLHNVPIGELQISTIEFLMTDFVVSPSHIKVFKKFHIGN